MNDDGWSVTIKGYLPEQTPLMRFGRWVWCKLGFLTWSDLWPLQRELADLEDAVEWLQMTPEQRADPILNMLRIVARRDVL